tara:strand:+ start:566 stop:913 length:348 start_codon:yes stop_codon:yes gene_type:complete
MITKQQVIDAINNDVINGDGHSIYPPEFYVEQGFDCEHLATEFESDLSNPKYTIFKNGVPQEKMKGIWALDFHYWVASQCGLVRGEDYADKYGRGSQAQAIAGALQRWATEKETV